MGTGGSYQRKRRMSRLALAFIAIAATAHAGDSVSPGPVEILLPTVIEVEQLGALFPPPLSDRWGDDDLRRFVFDGEPLEPPAPVPLHGGHLFLATALVSLAAMRLWRASA